MSENGMGPFTLVKGAGDFATGIIHRLRRSGFRVVATELERPLAVRRWVALSEAVFEGEYSVEGVSAVRCGPDEMDDVIAEDKVAILVDPGAKVLKERDFDIVVDARSAKRNLGTNLSEAPIVVAIGPGFSAGVDCHAVVETLAGRHLGRVILEGSAEPDTGSPFPIESITPCCCASDQFTSLVVRAPCDGGFNLEKDIGTKVEEEDILGTIETPEGEHREVKARAKGMVRGLIHDGTPVKEGMKLGDIDPTMNTDNLCTISEKSRAIGGGVLEACMLLLHRSNNAW